MKLGINGIGRIGRHILKNLLESGKDVVIINDINPDIKNVVYTLNYDTIYGRSKHKFEVIDDKTISYGDKVISYHCEPDICNVDWNKADYIIDSSGVASNAESASRVLQTSSVKKIFLTNSNKNADFEMVLGVNEELLKPEHNIIACSICDATAIAPVVRILENKFGILMGSISTMHPWLNYQNVLDGRSTYQSRPDQTYHNYALGRSSIGNLIPKWTSALDATDKVIPGLKNKMMVFSYRTPHAIVGSADLTFMLGKDIDTQKVIEEFEKYSLTQAYDIISNDYEPLVSSDYIGSRFSCHIDHRWTEVKNGMLKLVLWYDNEYGYSNRVIDQVERVFSMEKECQ